MDGQPHPLSEDEYEHIEDTIARSAKGRAFLRRYARRAQGGAADEIRRLLEQMRDVLGTHSEVTQTAQHIAVLRRELLEMAGSIEKARREVAALRPPENGNNKILSATNELDAIVTSTERASFDILNSAERLMDLAARLRRSGADAELCTDIEGEVTTIFTACSFQDLTGQRTSKVISALRYIEQRINAMIQIWGIEGVRPVFDMEPADARPDAGLLSGPALPGQGVSQSDVDAMFGSSAPSEPPGAEPASAEVDWDLPPEPAPEPAPVETPAAESRTAAADPEPPPAKAPPAEKATAALDQSAIDALFG